MKTGIIITARVKSNRLKNKVLQEIRGKKTIEILIDNLIGRHHMVDNKHDIILAIPDDVECNILEKIGIEKGINVYRGQDDSPLHRIYECAKEYGLDNVVRITADDILIDPMLLKNQIRFHENGGQDYTYMRRCPEGIAGEIIKTSAIEKVVEKVGDTPVEFISYYLKTKDFKSKEYYPPPDYQYSFRLTMDYPKDLLLLQIIFLSIAEPIGTLDIINFIKKHKYLLRVNALPKVTVYTCNYNQSRYIVECLNSVLNQGYKDFELIVLDDCSTDNSANVLTEWYSGLSSNIQNKVKVLRNIENIGLPASCNKVLGIAKGDYIIRVDSDDVLNSNAIETMLNDIQLNSKLGGIISGYDKIDANGNYIETILDNHWHPAGCLLDKRAVNEVKYKEGLEHFEGAEFFDRFRELYDIGFIDESLWKYRQHDEQKSSEKNRAKRESVKKENGIKSMAGSTTSI
jgi:spore coat polysaccharide biosynthesis protein SpsF (cytidylyltransferase family)